MKFLKKLSKALVATALSATLLILSVSPAYAAGTHTVTFMYGAKQVVQTVADGCNATLPTDTYVAGYNFLGWVGDASNVTSDRIIIGAYAKDVPETPAEAAATPSVGKTYTVRFVDGLTGGQYYKQVVSEGADANPPEVPHHDGYHFEGYSDSFTNVHSDKTIICNYDWDYYYHDDYDDWWWLWDDGDGDPYDAYIAYWWLGL